MAFIELTDVDAGVTAVSVSITNDAGLVWLPATSTLGPFTTIAAASVTLTEAPAGSRRFSATVPLPAGGLLGDLPRGRGSRRPTTRFPSATPT